MTEKPSIGWLRHYHGGHFCVGKEQMADRSGVPYEPVYDDRVRVVK